MLGLGAVLSQDGDRHVIAYASRVLTKAERQYCATRREMLAVEWAVRYFGAYLWGRCFIIRTDHKSLQWLKSFKDPQGQVARWLDILVEYDFSRYSTRCLDRSFEVIFSISLASQRNINK